MGVMPKADKHDPAGLPPEKVLAIGTYGETVAAYRYQILAEKAPSEHARREFAAMADEEQGHKQRLQALLADMYPDADFVLTAADKDMVVDGPRMIEVRDADSFAAAMRMILATEKKTAAFYAKLSKLVPQAHLRELFHELAEEGAEHYQRLRALAAKSGTAPSP